MSNGTEAKVPVIEKVRARFQLCAHGGVRARVRGHMGRGGGFACVGVRAAAMYKWGKIHVTWVGEEEGMGGSWHKEEGQKTARSETGEHQQHKETSKERHAQEGEQSAATPEVLMRVHHIEREDKKQNRTKADLRL